MNKTKTVQYEECVRKARAFVANYDKVRWTICDLAREACDLSKGGRKHPLYTLTRFAKDIELNEKTLYDWIRVQNLVVNKLPKTMKAKIHTYNYEDIRLASMAVKEDSSPKEVRSAFLSVLNRDPNETKFLKYHKHLKTVIYNLQRPMLVKDISKDVLTKTIELSKTITALAKIELDLREKYTGKKRYAKRFNMKDELIKRLNIGEEPLETAEKEEGES